MKNRFSSKAKAKLGFIGLGVVALSQTASAAVDLTTLNTQIGDGITQVESFAPIVIGFVITMVVIGIIIKLSKRAG